MLREKSRKPNNTYFNVNKPEIKFRIARIVEKIRAGYSRAKLLDFVEKEMDLNYQQANRYIHDAYITLSDLADEIIDSAKGVQIERIEELLRQSLEAKDRATASKSLDMLNRIYALYVDKKELDVSVDNLRFSFGDDVQQNTENNE